MPLMLGLDIGTSATKAVLIDESGAVLGTHASHHEYDSPHPGWTEQDPEVWWRATIDAIRSLIAAEAASTGRSEREIAHGIAAAGLSGQMHGSVLLDEARLDARGRAPGALRPAIMWNDQRTAAQCEEIEDAIGGRAALVEACGNAALTGFTLPKLMWVRKNEPETWSHARTFMMPKDYVRFRLTGEPASDVGDAAGTLLLSVDDRDWSIDLANRFGIDRDFLPPVHESGSVAGHVTAWASEQTGLAEGIPIVAGSGDNMMGALGAGVVVPGQALATLGTSGVLYAHSAQPRKDIDPDRPGRLHTMCAADGREGRVGAWCVTGCMLSAAGSLQWAHDALFPDASFAELDAWASGSHAGSEGLVFLPYLTGERCPHPDPSARGAWIGLTTRHDRGHMIRAVLEGVALSMGQIAGLMQHAGVPIERIRTGGGGAKSRLWRTILASVFDAPMISTNAQEGPAYGAALLAGAGVGVWSDVREACDTTIKETETIDPDPAWADAYREMAPTFDAMYYDLRERFSALTSIAHRF